MFVLGGGGEMFPNFQSPNCNRAVPLFDLTSAGLFKALPILIFAYAVFCAFLQALTLGLHLGSKKTG